MKKTTNPTYNLSLEKRILLICLLALLLLLLSGSAFAQNRWQASIRGGANFPIEDLGKTELNTGVGFDGTVSYRFLPHLSIYTGWGWNRFTPTAANTNTEFEETGYRLGLQFVYPIEKSKLQYVVSSGTIYNHIEVENNEGAIIDDSGHGFGWEAELGVSIPLSKRLHLVPSARYHSLERELSIGDTKNKVDLSYVSVGAGIVWKF